MTEILTVLSVSEVVFHFAQRYLATTDGIAARPKTNVSLGQQLIALKKQFRVLENSTVISIY